jgi:predicted AAA+ superfamily ATPase
MIIRKTYLSQLLKWKNQPVVKVITGIRRSGKSTLLEMFGQQLQSEDHILPDHIISLNFEDLDNEELTDYHRLYTYLKSRMKDRSMYYLFFDEIQMVKDFQRVIDSLLLRSNVDIYVTGSNAYLLSGEIATLLTGRYIEIKVYPLSFSEYLSTLPETTSPESAYRQYVDIGGFPYTLRISHDRQQIKDYLEGLYNTIVLKDVVTRWKFSDVSMLQSVVRFLTDNIGNVTAVKRISDTMTSAGRKISSHTVENFISALTLSYIFYDVTRYDVKGMAHLKTGHKYYLVDPGLRSIIIGTKTGDLRHILENVVYLELRRRYREVYVGKVGEAEINFISVDGAQKAYYQVALSVRDEHTLNRELAPLNDISDHYPKYLLTLDNDPVVSHNGIQQIYVLDWLRERSVR